MNWDAVGAIGEVVGAIGVILTLVYLAIQIRQNTAATRGTSYQQYRTQVHDLVAHRLTDTELTKIWMKGLSEPSSLDDLDSQRFGDMIFLLVGNIESMWHLKSAGILDETMGSSTVPLIKSPGFRHWWDARKHWYSDEFQDYVDSHMSKSRNGP